MTNSKHPENTVQIFAKKSKSVSLFPAFMQACFVVIFFVAGCQNSSKKMAVGMGFTSSKKTIRLTGFDPAVLADLARDSSDKIWQALAPVYKMPGDTDLKNYQPLQPGRYVVAGSALTFTPDTPFATGQTYFVRCYQYGAGKRPADYITGLRRVGRPQFTDLIFKR